MKEKLVKDTKEFVKRELHHAEGGHDWWHALRVWKLACCIAPREKADLLIVEPAALLHDIADAKFNAGNAEKGKKRVRDFLSSTPLPSGMIDDIITIVDGISYRHGHANQRNRSREFMVVQDADRLDAMGAIGIARTFNYGGYMGREIYNPAIQPETNMTLAGYRNHSAPTINHFHEKLLKLKDLMNTTTARELAESRHVYMLEFLERFHGEWKGRM